MSRKERKTEHLQLALEQRDNKNVFKDVQILGNSISEIDLDEICYKTRVANIQLETPFIFNAITGGNKSSYWINQNLALVARELGFSMAVGSQKAALEDSSVSYTFEVVREVNPEGIIFANLGAYASPDDAKEAVKMIDADAIQIHLNFAQELVMAEGDKKFKGYLKNISDIVDSLSVPVIVKEVGQGIAGREAKKLIDLGVSAIDIGGYGGTNFIEIENSRRKEDYFYDLEGWGIPTPKSLLEVLAVNPKDTIASGGIASSLDAFKAMVLGAKAIAIAGYPLRILMKNGREALIKELSSWLLQLKYYYLLAGVKETDELTKVSAVIEGELNNFARERGINTKCYTVRNDAL
ncbi:type 2 isopentenyl-diphosphate Delta-isomerase [Natranaerofaba carboxydovora]|uniref:type 2 isopentenyl-diphosphate Delta-isomerase n=1 Tax=Natranaerofaba carboxydovora TaxID=2742683 RepID=UPI001F136B9B|nr:type 2 isopentenyl-diphosphate Delta-isomerase [Natranaerofaba carboxydovora]UMZ73891.1 Isopentenyl-diphosphate delta-isomerase [Natranaerofaba carboxydovora]